MSAQEDTRKPSLIGVLAAMLIVFGFVASIWGTFAFLLAMILPNYEKLALEELMTILSGAFFMWTGGLIGESKHAYRDEK